MKRRFITILSLAFLVLCTVSLTVGAAPSKAPVTLTSFQTIVSEIDPITGGDPNNTPFQKALAKATGVTLKWILATPEDAQDKLRLLIASREVPDLFAADMNATYPGGPSKAAEDGIIAKINPYLDTLARDYKAVFSSKPQYKKNLCADNGDIYGFACFRSEVSTVFFGPMIRKDILDKEGVPVPETIDEWYVALKALKKNGVKNPLSMLDWYVGYSGAFVGAYGGCAGYYVGSDQKIHYGAMEAGWRQYLVLMNKWYAEGLLDPDASTMKDMGVLNTKMTSGTVGACLGWINRVKSYTVDARKTNPDFNIVPTLYPVLKKGTKPLYGQNDSPVVQTFFIGGTEKNKIEEAIKWYDYGYTKEGHMLYNFGILGESYTMDATGKPVYSEEIYHNSKGWTESQAKQMYFPIIRDAPAQEHVEYFLQSELNSPVQREAMKLWGNARYSSSLPNLSYQSAEMKLMEKDGDINTYVMEQTAKFILGETPLNDKNWADFQKRLKSLGIDQTLAAYNGAYARYLKR
jgi:putative aldouronate transport system substrate-binding protein